MVERLVAIALGTTGFSPSRDAVIEFGAVRIEEGKIGGRFSELADPGCALPLRVTRRIGIRSEDLRGRPAPRAVAAELLRFIGDDPVISHNPEFDTGFLRELLGAPLPNSVYDSLQLSRVLWPTQPSHDLEPLVQALGIGREVARRAGDAAHALAQLWLKLVVRIEEMPLAVVAEIALLLEPTDHPLRDIFREAGRRLTDKVFQHAQVSAEDLLKDFSAIIQKKEKPRPRVDRGPLDVGALCELFLPGGVLEQRLPGYEYRAEQARMVKEVAEAFNDGLILMIDAGTGTGKSMAYLVPAIAWAVRNGAPVVISTNTKNLQAQLFTKDIPFLEETLGLTFRKALIKGRGNYLCARKFLHTVRHADQELTEKERIQMPPLIPWLYETETGDVAENNGFTADFNADLWNKLSTQQDECVGRSCRYFRKCFVRRARALSLAAHIIVANHSVVFSEMGVQESVVLPPYRHCVFDEAHNLENIATEHLAVRVSAGRIYRGLNRLHRGRRDGTGTGLFTHIRYQLSGARRSVPKKFYEEIEGRIRNTIGAIPHVVAHMDAFFNAVGLLFARRGGQSDKIRFGRGAGMPGRWGPVAAGSRKLGDALERFAGQVEMIHDALALLAEKAPQAAELGRDLQTQAAVLREVHTDLDFLMQADDPEYVYWAEQIVRRATWREVCAAPLDVTRIMTENVYRANRTVVLSSATLAVTSQAPGDTAWTGDADPAFRFMTERLGLRESTDRLRAVNVGSSFDFGRQVLFAVPAFLPDPRDAQGRFTKSFAELTTDILTQTAGRGLVLFTSYNMLNESRPIIKEALETEGILVLAQGVDGSRSKITETFRKDTSSVLLGTQSFWEGVDVAGESLSCLVLAKLPFQVFTEPIIKARCELIESRGGDAFMGYSVPAAVIRLKQGFGRLIRSRSDRGVIVLMDKRIMTRVYGRQFLRSLPAAPRSFPRKPDLLRALADFFHPSRSPATGSGP